MLTHYLDLFFKRFDSPDIHPFRFVSKLNRDCSIVIDCYDCPGIFCFAKYTIIPYKYFLTNFVVVINPAMFSQAVSQSVSRCLCSPIFFQSAMNGKPKSMSRPNIAAPGEAFNTVC